MDNKKLLDIKNLTISFHTYVGEVAAVRNVDFYLKKSEVLAIVGESGSGKSVSTQAILGLTPIPPGEIKSGKILFKHEDLLKFNEKEMSKICGSQISMIFQDPMTSLNPTMKVGNQIREVLHQHSDISRRESRERAIELMTLVRIPEPEMRIDQYPHELSGGMRQRVMITIAMANRPDILIADEPTTALDVTIQAQIFRLLKELRTKFDTAIILITHDFGVVAGIADRIVIMYAGKVMEENETDQVYYEPRHPYTVGLLKAVPSLADNEEDKLRTIDGTPPFLLKIPSGCPFADRCDYVMRICKEKEPQYFQSNDSSRVFCWLYHDQAAGQLQRFKDREGRIR
jgi:oligopeptide transport system ATP-binding protein